MKILTITLASFLVAAAAAAQTATPVPTPAPERAPAGPNLNLRLDDATRRSIVSEPAREKGTPEPDGALPTLGAGSKRSFEAPRESRSKSNSGTSPFPKAVDAM